MHTNTHAIALFQQMSIKIDDVFECVICEIPPKTIVCTNTTVKTCMEMKNFELKYKYIFC